MKQGQTLQELAIELDRQAKSKKDYLASVEAIKMVPGEKNVLIEGLNGEPKELTERVFLSTGRVKAKACSRMQKGEE